MRFDFAILVPVVVAALLAMLPMTLGIYSVLSLLVLGTVGFIVWQKAAGARIGIRIVLSSLAVIPFVVLLGWGGYVRAQEHIGAVTSVSPPAVPDSAPVATAPETPSEHRSAIVVEDGVTGKMTFKNNGADIAGNGASLMSVPSTTPLTIENNAIKKNGNGAAIVVRDPAK